jgi:hypothetical protein
MLIHRTPPRFVRHKTRLSTFIYDASKRSRWGCQVALTLFAIDAANEALVKEWL